MKRQLVCNSMKGMKSMECDQQITECLERKQRLSSCVCNEVNQKCFESQKHELMMLEQNKQIKSLQKHLDVAVAALEKNNDLQLTEECMELGRLKDHQEETPTSSVKCRP